MSDAVERIERELDWDSPIENDSPDFVTLPAGDYDFEVVTYERGRHGGSEKLPSCGKATLHIKIQSPEGTTTIKHNLFLHTKTEGLLCEFFTSIGARKKGQKINMDWDAVMWAKGRAKVGIRKWKTDSGEERTGNEIKQFYPKESSTPKTGSASYTAGDF